MTNLKQAHQLMTERSLVVTDDGAIGRILRIDTSYPTQETSVTIDTFGGQRPGVAKVDLSRLVGRAVESVTHH